MFKKIMFWKILEQERKDKMLREKGLSPPVEKKIKNNEINVIKIKRKRSNTIF